MVYFAASCDSPEENKKFAESLELDYPILRDPEKAAAKSYGVVNDDSKFPKRWTFYIGKDGKLMHIDKEVKAGSHGADLVAKLKELKIEPVEKKN